MKKQRVPAGILALLVSVISQPASADLYRCEMPGGKVVFTDREEVCPGADAHTLDAEIQSYERNPAALAPAPTRASPSNAGGESAPKEALWREKKDRAEKDLRALEEKWHYLSEYITHCNRHRKVLSENQAGLPYEVSCKNIREEYSQVKVHLDETRGFLEKDLQEECRRAGCQPGWIR